MVSGTPGEHDDLVAGRTCDGCTMCCKLLDIDVLEKPRGTWCSHCDKKRGCKIYETRPEPCRSFYCGYRRIGDLDERWKPSHCKLLINYESANSRIALHVDPERAGAWRTEPFYSTIKEWAARAEASGGTLVVWAGRNITVVGKNRDVDLGALRDDQFILPVDRRTPGGVERDYIAVEANDPRLKI